MLFRVPVELRMELVQMQCTDSNLCTIQISPEVYIGILQKQIRHLIEDRSAPVLSFLDATALTRLAEIPPAEAIAFERQLTKVLQIDTWFRLYQPRLI